MPVFIQNNMPPIGSNLSAECLLKLCREIEHVEYIKEETLPSTVKLTDVIEGDDGSCKGVFGGAGGRYLIEEYMRVEVQARCLPAMSLMSWSAYGTR